MDQTQLEELLSVLPPWLQLLLLVAVVVAGALFGKRVTKKRKRPSSPAGRSSAGQRGSDATRDLTVQEIAQVQPSYDPHPDGDADPGEIVWTWVPYAENDGRGKDRPVLIIARLEGDAVAGCYLSTSEHRGFVHVGSGPWDHQGRSSYLNAERLLRLSEHGLRREGAVLDETRFRAVTAQIMRLHTRR